MTSSVAFADNDDFSDIRILVRQGKLYSLEKILEKYLPRYNGRLLDLEVEKKRGMIIYELEILLPDRRVIELTIDAENGELLYQEIED